MLVDNFFLKNKHNLKNKQKKKFMVKFNAPSFSFC